MVYVLDGYNVIHAVPGLERKLDTSLRAARDALVALCLEIRHCRGDVEKTVIVFDGDSAFSDLPQENFPGVEIVFTESREDADDRILDVLREYPARQHLCVVSNDHYVLNHARAFGTQVMNASKFQALALPKPLKHKKNDFEDDAIPGPLAQKLTEDYKRYLGLD